MVNDRRDGAVKTTIEARQGSRHKPNLHVLLIAMALLAIVGVALYMYVIERTPLPMFPGTGVPPQQ